MIVENKTVCCYRLAIEKFPVLSAEIVYRVIDSEGRVIYEGLVLNRDQVVELLQNFSVTKILTLYCIEHGITEIPEINELEELNV